MHRDAKKKWRYEKTCVDCGQWFKEKAPHARLCKECAEKRIKHRDRLRKQDKKIEEHNICLLF